MNPVSYFVGFLGAAAIVLGILGFTKRGIPIDGVRRVSGKAGMVLGAFTIAVGVGMIALSWYLQQLFARP
jgi:formate hydrogenlyase subunit 3/multisubunit Na+/H+ antiporter MnhD subunit